MNSIESVARRLRCGAGPGCPRGPDRVADLDRRQPDDRDDVSRVGLLDFHPAQLVEQENAVDRPRNRDTVRLQQCGFLPRGPFPEMIRPIAIRPTYSEKSIVVQSIENGRSSST